MLRQSWMPPNPIGSGTGRPRAGLTWCVLSSEIADLDPPFRIVFQLRDIEKLSTEETAEALGLLVPAVKSRLLRARLKLRKKLNKYFPRNNPRKPAVFKDERI
jgi:DNA-directed RNA polymerase specialized sigma24 family protein